MTEDDRKIKILDLATDVRKFEIGLFWQRSLFFWGFIAAAFVAYAALAREPDKDLGFAIACFGLVCSLAWTLGNRGGKYWQEAWEAKVESVERDVLGEALFHRIELVQPKGSLGQSQIFRFKAGNSAQRFHSSDMDSIGREGIPELAGGPTIRTSFSHRSRRHYDLYLRHVGLRPV